MAKKHHNYSAQPHVITDTPRPCIERFRLTPDEFAARYHALSPVTCPRGSSVVVTITAGVMRYVVELPALLGHDGYASELAER